MSLRQPAAIVEESRAAVASARAAKLRAEMRVAGVPIVLIQDPINIVYACGATNMTLFAMRTAARFLMVFAEGPTILFEYRGCEHLARGLATVDRILPARGLCHVTSGGKSQESCAAFAREIAGLAREYGTPPALLGIDRLPFPAVDALRVEGFTPTDADVIFGAARRHKLPDEIVLMREGLHRVIDAAAEMAARIEPGRGETEIWADFQRPFLAQGGQYVTTRLAQGGPNTYPYFQQASDRPLRAGELFCFDTDANGFECYATDFSRTFLCGDGPANPVQKDLFAKAKAQLDWNVDLIRPGLSFREIAERAWPVPEEHLDSRYYCIGHGLGLSGEVPNIPHIEPNTPYPLDGGPEPGMVICVESYIGSAGSGQGVKLEDQLMVTETGVDRMSAPVSFDPRLETRVV